MRHLPRVRLPRRVLDALATYQDGLDRAVGKARRMKRQRLREVTEAAWKARRRTSALDAVELALDAMASGLERCMYCEDSRASDVEHFRPKVSHPECLFEWTNLLKVCADCNREKNDAFSEHLLNPTVDDPFDHLVLSPATGRFVAREGSDRGRDTLRILRRLGTDQMLTRGRALAWVRLQALLHGYADHRAAGRDTDAEGIRDVVVNEPFSGIFAALLRACTEPEAADVLGGSVVAVLARHPEMRSWLRDADVARVARAQPMIDAKARAVRIRRSPDRTRRRPRPDS